MKLHDNNYCYKSFYIFIFIQDFHVHVNTY